MLQILRNKAQSTFIQVIVVIIALVFIFWGVGANMMNSRQTAITVNDEEISFEDFQITYDRTYQNIAAQFGGTLPKGLAESLGLKEQVINQLVQAALLRQGAASMGIIVSQEEIQNTITSMVQFQESNGFSMDKYKSLLSANRLTPHKFETNMRFDMLAEKTVRDIGNFAALSSDYEVQQLYRQDNEKVSVNFTRISPDDFTSSITVTDDALASWFETVRDNYRSEPQISLKYIDFSFAEVGKKITIDDAQIQAYYNENTALFTTPEKRRARHILLKAGQEDSEELHKEKAKRAAEIAVLAAASDDFAALAKEYSEGPSSANGGELGFFAQGQMIPAFEQAVFAMNPGEISKVVKTSYGYHVIKLEEIQPTSTRSLNEAKAEIISALQAKEAESLAFQLANSAYESIIGAGSLDSYATATPDQKIIITGYFPRSTPPAGLSIDGEFLDKAFSLNAGELSSLVKTTSGFYIIFAEGVQEPESPMLETVKEKATTDYIAKLAVEQAQKTAGDILGKLQAGESFADVISATALELKDSGFLDRNSTEQASFPAALTEQVFRLSKTEPLPQTPATVGDDLYVFKFKERQLPDSANNDELEKYRQELLLSKQQELLSAYISNLEKVAEITVNKSL
jgi:peptidyl-prolyl cis-trans isomerase D